MVSGDRHDVQAPDEHVVEDRLDHVDEPGAGRGVAGGGEPGHEEQAAVGPREGEQPPELPEVLAEVRPHRRQPMSQAEVSDGRLRPARGGTAAGVAGRAMTSSPYWRVF